MDAYCYTIEPDGSDGQITGNLYAYSNMSPATFDACILNWMLRRKFHYKSRLLYARSLMNYVGAKRHKGYSNYVILIYTTPQQ